MAVYESLRRDSDSDNSSEASTVASDTCAGVARIYKNLLAAREPDPDPSGLVASLVMHRTFGIASFVVILFNAAFAWVVTDSVAAMLQPEAVAMGHAEEVDLLFLSYYAVEVLLKLYVHRFWFFWNDDWAWNIFDFLVVLLGISQALLEEFTDAKSLDVTFIRICRILRISKILRIFKAVRFLSELRLMATCVVGSLGSLFWTCMFLFLILMMSALLLVQSMATFRLENPDCDEHLCQQIPDLFGSVLGAMQVLLECVTGGCDWGDVYKVVQLTGAFNSCFFIFYILFSTFAFFNIVMSLFVDKAMKYATPDANDQLVERRKDELKTSKELHDLFRDMDPDESGTISITELKAAFDNQQVRNKFEVLGITVREALVFFETLVAVAKQESLDIDEFVQACMKMKGPASGLDMQAIDFQVKNLTKKLDSFRRDEALPGHGRQSLS